MNAHQKIRQALRTAYDEGEANAMEIFKGYAADTLETGWHCRKFGRSEHIYLGNSVAEAQETVKEIIETREVVPWLYR